MVQVEPGLVAAAEVTAEVTMWLILGANGQLGRSMLDALLIHGLPARSASRSECDITNYGEVEHLVREVSPTHVVNCAAWTAVDAAEDHEEAAMRLNSSGAGNVARACRSAGSRLFHISTDYVFAGDKIGPYEVDDETVPATKYGESKLSGELAVRREHGDNSCVVRTAWLYSKYGNNFVKTMIRRALTDTPVQVVNDQVGQPTSAAELAHHLIALAQHMAPAGVYHGTNSGQGTWFDFAREIYDLAGRSIQLVSPVSSSQFPTKARRPRNSVLSHTRTVAVGVHEMRPWKEALADDIRAIISEVEQESN